MDIARISPDEEQKLISSVQTAITQANGGMDPSEAVAKVASDQGYNPEFASRMVAMFNTSKTLSHLSNSEGSDRAVDFPVANIEKVAEYMAPTAVKPEPAGEILAKNANFMAIEEPLFEKAAAEELKTPDPGYPRWGVPVVERALNAELNYRRKIAEAKTQYSAALDILESAFRKLALYFRSPGHASFEEVETRVCGMHKMAGEVVMNVAWHFLGNMQKREKRGGHPEDVVITDMSEKPYSFV
ncbi:MAG TPA: hypothetical protein ENH11_10585, partial [Candidatus Acetothermia bacterium]|nr:hypothetical protein [Candidatus Acetothermia bacterium]